MILQLRHVISNWENSGQGDRGCVNELDAVERVFNDQKIFIKEKSIYLIYLWELFETHKVRRGGNQ